MPDMLVKLYGLPDLKSALNKVIESGVAIGRPTALERSPLLNWIQETFGPRWVKECEISFSSSPTTCFIAKRKEHIVGFACYECTAKNFFGPAGVSEADRNTGVGKALLLTCLHTMKEMGYGYAIIGGVGPADFYAKTVGAKIIEGSESSIYA